MFDTLSVRDTPIGVFQGYPHLAPHPPTPRPQICRYIEGDITASERVAWESNFETPPDDALTTEEKEAFLAELTGVSLSSDAFFPFRDSIDHASKVRWHRL